MLPICGECEFEGFAKTTRFSVCRGPAIGAAPLQTEKPVRFPCPAGLDIVEPLVQIEREAVSTEAVSTNGEQGGRLKQIFN